jgi:hypothetical protein
VNEGYEVQISNGYLVIAHIPYVNKERHVLYGTLIATLDLAGDKTAKPKDHVVRWAGEYPCYSNGLQLEKLVNNPNISEQIRTDLVATCIFSHKPEGGYPDYYQKMTTYIRIVSHEARVLDPEATAKTFPVYKLNEEESVFNYLDTASSRAGITSINERLKKGKIAIVGMGGTGSYVLDLVAKTIVEEIHIFDGDYFFLHNAFRSPGGPSAEELSRKPTKVEWFSEIYSKMRRNIVPHFQFVNESNLESLKGMSFVFLCLDSSEPKKKIENFLTVNKISFIDVGMGLNIQNNSISGLVRVTTSTPNFNGHLESRVPFTSDDENQYSTNIQVSEMNALNAALAVIKWKKIWGFYKDIQHEHHTVYGISGNIITNEDVNAEN